jgi:CheY-like chemotaxis protein
MNMPGKILIVDDNDDSRMILSHIIETMGYEPVTMADGVAALRWLSRELPGLMFLDLMMPTMNGFQVLAYLKSMGHTNRFPIVVISALTDPAQLSDLPGVARVIQKAQFTVHSVTDLVTELLVQPPAAETAEENRPAEPAPPAPNGKAETPAQPEKKTKKETPAVAKVETPSLPEKKTKKETPAVAKAETLAQPEKPPQKPPAAEVKVESPGEPEEKIVTPT